MRLICPNCDAQYEVDDNAIPQAGRDVQCSNCGHAWFQERAPDPEDASAALYREPESEATTGVPEALVQAEDEEDEAPPLTQDPPPKRSLDDSVLAVLREEAEREAAARKADAAGLEMQGDLGLPPPVSPSVGASAAAAVAATLAAEAEDVQDIVPGRAGASTAPPEPMTDTEKRIAAMQGKPAPRPRPAARRDLLPDVEEINSTLSPSDTSSRYDADDLPDLTKAKRSGFRSGFVLMVLVAALATTLYLMAPQISQQIPGAAETMTAYVAAVDAGRVWLDGMIRQATGLLNGFTGGGGA